MDTSADLTNARYEDEGLRNKWFYTSDFAMYTLEGGKGYLYFGGEHANPILSNLSEACTQLISQHRYLPGTRARHAVLESVKSGNTLRLQLSDLDLDTLNDGSGYFEIDTADHHRLNDAQRLLAERIFGGDRLFEQNMEIFFDVSIFTTKVSVLNSDYVAGTFAEGEADARIGWLYIFDNYSKFNAVDTNVGEVSAVRGVLSVAEEGDADA
jgi:hypothetical protein|tara:strand:+ start:1627 stop:2259 length:633 start_codon:yes stop_codon:yes gene_type:complete